jgi:lipopolysaccharide/colanic/teichoic acid biosynthesis glycosyltransferase
VLVGEPRLGEGGRVYPMLRFRTTGRTGRLLHRSGLDGLPQLLNVLTGSMSLVGPRPLRPDEHAGRDGAAARRLLVRPGVTGLRQVMPTSSERHHTNEPALGETVRLVLRYLEIWSVTLDVAILWKTLAAAARHPRRTS